MKTAFISILKITGIVLLVVILLALFLIFKIMTAPMVPNNYTRTVETGGALEAAYLDMGSHKVKYIEAKADEVLKKYEIYYPAELEDGEGKYPLVLFVNGTGVYGSKYRALFRHLASWGFIVAGNEDPSTWTGASADRTLAYLLEENGREDSPFYQRIDLENIGISGHSQGGVGVLNAITEQKNSGIYKAAVSLSPTNKEVAHALEWDYDASLVSIPLMLLSGAGGGDDWVVTGEQLADIYRDVPGGKVMASRKDTPHGQTLYAADGYVTAWFLWQLQGDQEAGRAFTGQSPELLENPLYQNVALDLETP